MLGASRHPVDMSLAHALLRNPDVALTDEVAELALRMAMETGDHTDVVAWLVRQQDPSPAVVRVVLGGYAGAEMCLRDHRLMKFIPKLTHAEQEEVLHGLVDAFRAGRVHRWYGLGDLVRLGLHSSDPDIRAEVIEPWFVRTALSSSANAVILEYQAVDPLGAWMKALLERESDLAVEVLALLVAHITSDHIAAGSLPWRAHVGDAGAETAYAARLLELAASMVPREHWKVLARLGSEWEGTLGELVTCVNEVTRE